jgi:dienelactone hydrolase
MMNTCVSGFKPTIKWRRRIVSRVAMVLILPLLFVTSAQAHHTALPAGMSEPEAAWLWGYHAIPADITRDNSPYWYGYTHTDVSRINNPAWTTVAATHIRPGAQAPAVLIAHGCSGLPRGPAEYRLWFMKQGYAVLEPDSFARPGHTCNDNVLGKSALDIRTQDLRYALEQMRKMAWIDPDRIVLMGISQGGAAVAKWDASGVQAHIILENHCAGQQPKAPQNIPVLTIIGGEDEYLKGTSCKVTRTLKGSRSIVIPGAPHALDWEPEVAAAISEFLDSCCR